MKGIIMAEKYTLPELPYDYAALEPHISAKIMELHHDKQNGAYGNVSKLSKDLAFNLGGHTNHSIFWNNLSPEGGDKPTGELAAAIDEFFGSFDKFREHFTNVALTIQGSGWAILAWDTVGKRLIIEQLYDQQGNISVALIPVLQLDMWEHAFYLDYQNVKGEYVKAFWNIVNWADVQARFERAVSQTKGLVL